jgi:ABC-type branched-subunit amino acid transport system ATPase component
VLDAQAVGPTGDGRDPDHTVVLRIEGLDKRFGGLTAVSKVNLTLRRGRIAALIGPNGAGKTTIFNLITGVLRPDAGRVTLNGVDLAGRSTVAIAELGMARSFQNVRLFQQISALDNVALAVPGQVGEHLWQLVLRPRKARFGERETRRKAMAYLEYVGIADRADERVSNLSFAGRDRPAPRDRGRCPLAGRTNVGHRPDGGGPDHRPDPWAP